jgi:23S rRNA pseudouridine1911/1915/1917 synthase
MEPIQDDFSTRCEVLPQEAGWRLDKCLAEHFPELSRTRLQQLIKEGHVCLQASACEAASYKVKTGEVYTLFIPPLEETPLLPQAMNLVILYEDADLLVIDKPAGLVVHPGAGQPDGTLVNGLLAHCGESLSGISGVKRPGIVHRLDKGTSGLLVVAKHDQAHQALSAQFEDRSLSRVYIAFVWGAPVPLHGVIDKPIGRHPVHRQKMAVLTQGGRASKTFYATKKIYAQHASLLSCKLETGRTHQIRVHLASLGYPVLGDPVYGNARRRALPSLKAFLEETLAPDRQALHASTLTFVHPATQETLFFESKLPADMETLRSYLETVSAHPSKSLT